MSAFSGYLSVVQSLRVERDSFVFSNCAPDFLESPWPTVRTALSIHTGDFAEGYYAETTRIGVEVVVIDEVAALVAILR